LTIPIANELAEECLRSAREPSYSIRTTSHRLRELWHKAGVVSDRRGKASFHSLRATFISMMDEAGVPPHVTDSITGHAKQGMHGRYSQPGLDAKRDAIERALPRLLVAE
jgi:integrase